jgi:hypothetical protein
MTVSAKLGWDSVVGDKAGSSFAITRQTGVI